MINLDELVSLHPDLPSEIAAALATCAAVALERRYQPGVRLAAVVRGLPLEIGLVWRPRRPKDASMLDAKRATEDGAECIALALLGHDTSWRLVRRLQSRLGEGADWLVKDPKTGHCTVLEISGTDDGPFERRLRSKVMQARSAASGRGAAACVVRFLEPRAELYTDDGPS
jgi:hypothetical protein